MHHPEVITGYCWEQLAEDRIALSTMLLVGLTIRYYGLDLPPKKESSYNVSLEGQKRATKGVFVPSFA